MKTFNGTVKTVDGVKRFVPLYPALWGTMLNKCKEDQPATIYFKEIKQVRSLKSNSLYWVYLGIIESETGNEVDDLHKLFKKKFLPWKIKEVYGEKLLKLTSTTELSTDEFSEYMLKIERETGIPIPDPKAYKENRDSAELR
jgi:uncharacterized protein YbcI